MANYKLIVTLTEENIAAGTIAIVVPTKGQAKALYASLLRSGNTTKAEMSKDVTLD